MTPIVIAIDGFSSCGKSTLARQLAARLGFRYIDSGAMYRAITLYFLRNRIDWTNAGAVHDALAQLSLGFLVHEETGHSEIYLNGENVEYLIRDLVVAEKVSEVAALKEVRDFAVAVQQELGLGKGIVMDGRDIGTTVFPDAELKIFLTASPEVRVARRFRELQERNPAITQEEVRKNLETRDYIDSHRVVSPLRKATDALELDNSFLTPDQTLKAALDMAAQKMSRNEA
jgi:cytidylate kinase